MAACIGIVIMATSGACVSEYEPSTSMEIVFVCSGEVPDELLADYGFDVAGSSGQDVVIRMTLNSMTMFSSLGDDSLNAEVDLYQVAVKFDDRTRWDSGTLLVPIGEYNRLRLDIGKVEVQVMNLERPGINSSIDVRIDLSRMPSANLWNFVVDQQRTIAGDMLIIIEADDFTQDAGTWFVEPEIVFSPKFVSIVGG